MSIFLNIYKRFSNHYPNKELIEFLQQEKVSFDQDDDGIRLLDDLTIHGGAMILKGIVEAKNITLTYAESFSAPVLKKCNNIYVEMLGYTYLKYLEPISLPQLQQCSDIDIRCAGSFSAPRLQNSGHIDIREAKSFLAPQLKQCGNMDLHDARSFSAKQLQESGSITAYNATLFPGPQIGKARPYIPAKTINTLHFIGN